MWHLLVAVKPQTDGVAKSAYVLYFTCINHLRAKYDGVAWILEQHFCARNGKQNASIKGQYSFYGYEQTTSKKGATFCYALGVRTKSSVTDFNWMIIGLLLATKFTIIRQSLTRKKTVIQKRFETQQLAMSQVQFQGNNAHGQSSSKYIKLKKVVVRHYTLSFRLV